MSRKLPPLNALRAFEAAARLKSVSRAADELSVTQGAVSHQVKALEAWAGRAASWLAAGDDVFFFLHNPDDTFGPEMARLFHALVAARQPVPPLPEWDSAPPAPQQPALL